MKLMSYLLGENNELSRRVGEYLENHGVPYEFSTETGIITEGCGIRKLPVLLSGNGRTLFFGLQSIVKNINMIKELSTLVFDSEGISIMPAR